jgi:glycosyltransferase involved in cell wall biosynthesis
MTTFDSAPSREATEGGAPLTSIVLAVRNGESTLADAIHSILWQSYRDWELIVVDDGSTDGTVPLVRTFRDPRIRLTGDHRGLGLAARLNEGLQMARGTYVARMDADDIALPDRLEAQVRFLEHHPAVDVVGGAAWIVDDTLRLRGIRRLPDRHEAIVASRLGPIALMHPSIVARTSWYRRHRYDPRLLGAEDQELFVRAAPDSRYANLEEPVIAYREGPLRWRKQWRNRRYQFIGTCRLARERGALAPFARTGVGMMAKMMFEAVAIAIGRGDAVQQRRRHDVTVVDHQRWTRLLEELHRSSGGTALPAPPSRQVGAGEREQKSHHQPE